MAQATIGFAALRNSNKEIPMRAIIPLEVMIASIPPTFLEVYGNFMYIMFCVIFAAYVIQPAMETRYDVNNTEH